MRRSIPFYLGILALAHLYVGWRLLPDLPIGLGAQIVGALVLVASFVSVPLGFFARNIESRKWGDILSAVCLFLVGFFSSLFVFTLLRDVALLFALLWMPIGRILPITATLVVSLATLATLVGLLNARRRARVVNVEVPVANLPKSLHGFTIAQISDVHVGPTIKRRYVDAIVDAVNSLKADVIAVTGDLVDGSVKDLASHTAPWRALSRANGAFFVTGNHEYYSGEPAWTAEFQRLGMRVLMNEHVVLTHEGSQVVLAGVADYSAHHFDPRQRSDPERAMRDAPASAGARILLAHQPRSAPAAAAASSGRGLCSCAFNSRSRPGCIG